MLDALRTPSGAYRSAKERGAGSNIGEYRTLQIEDFRLQIEMLSIAMKRLKLLGPALSLMSESANWASIPTTAPSAC